MMFAARLAAGLASVALCVAVAPAFGQRQVGPTMCACPGKHKPLGSARTCEEACFGGAGTSGNSGSAQPPVQRPTIDYEAERRAREAEEQAERERQAGEARRRQEDAERQARFVRDRDAAAATLRGSIGTSAGANSAGGPQLRGSTEVAVGRQLRAAVAQPDLGGREAAWKQLHCAASILGPAIAALDLDSKSGNKPDFNEFRFLADEAANALNGQKLRVSCAPAPAMPKYSGPAKEPARQAQAEQRLVAKVLDLGTKLEDARRKQDEARGKLRGDAAPKVDPAADVIEQQRRINRARDAAGNEMAKAQRDFNEGKRSEESAKRELQKIQKAVENVEQGKAADFTIDLTQESAPRRRREKNAE